VKPFWFFLIIWTLLRWSRTASEMPRDHRR